MSGEKRRKGEKVGAGAPTLKYHIHAYPMRSKAEASEILLYIKRFEKQSGHTVKSVHYDNGTEFKRALIQLTETGAITTTSTPHTPQSNELANRTHQIIMNDIRVC